MTGTEYDMNNISVVQRKCKISHLYPITSHFPLAIGILYSCGCCLTFSLKENVEAIFEFQY